jgi:hypothetical protein
MKNLLIFLCAALLFSSCSLKDKEFSPEPSVKELSWVKEKMNEYSACTCITIIAEAKYENETVIEVSPADPACNGISQVYNKEGNFLFSSINTGKYADYMANRTERKIVWTCSR